MAGRSREVKVFFSGDHSGLTRTIGAVDKQVETVGQRLDRVGSKMASTGLKMTLGITGPLALLGKTSVEAFAEAEEGVAKFNAALANSPKLAHLTADSFDDLNSALARKTKFDDDAILSGQAVLANFDLTEQQLRTLTPLVLDYAERTGKDLPAAAQAIGLALRGQGRAMKAVGLDIKDTGDATQNYQQVVDGLTGKLGGLAEAAGKTTAGQMAILQNQTGELQEELGAALAPTVARVTNTLTDLASEFADLSPETQNVALGIAGVLAVAGPLTTAIGGLAKASSATITGGQKLVGWVQEARLQMALGKAQGLSYGDMLKSFVKPGLLGVGVALGAGALALKLYTDRKKQATQAAQEFADTLDKETGALTESSFAWITETIQQMDRFGTSMQSLAQDVGVPVEDLATAAVAGGEKLDQLNASLLETAGSSSVHATQARRLYGDLQRLREAVEGSAPAWRLEQAVINAATKAATGFTAAAGEVPTEVHTKFTADTAPARFALDKVIRDYKNAEISMPLRVYLANVQGDGIGMVEGGTAASMAASVLGAFKGHYVSSGYRPGAVTASGNRSYHADASNPAQDIAPGSHAMFDMLKTAYGSQIREMIYGHRIYQNGRESYWPANDHLDHLHVADEGGFYKGPGVVRIGAGYETFASGLRPAQKVAELPNTSDNRRDNRRDTFKQDLKDAFVAALLETGAGKRPINVEFNQVFNEKVDPRHVAAEVMWSLSDAHRRGLPA